MKNIFRFTEEEAEEMMKQIDTEVQDGEIVPDEGGEEQPS